MQKNRIKISGISKKHIRNVINIFCEELVKYLIDGNIVDVTNFIEMKFHKMKPKKHHNVRDKKIHISNGNSKLKLSLKRNLKKIILKSLKQDEI
jgi:nucleoid DNA-binding protein